MRILVSGCTKTVAAVHAERPERIGALLTPSSGNVVPPPGVAWAADNDCFRGLDPVRWLRFLARVVETGAANPPLWVSCPDAVGDAAATWASYLLWSPVMRSLGLPVALVLQDGVERFKYRAQLAAEWDSLAAVFVGGTTRWKESAEVAELADAAKARGKWVHVGRVNSERRIRRFAEMGVDSIDGSGWSRWGEVRIRRGVKWIDSALAYHAMPGLFSGAC